MQSKDGDQVSTSTHVLNIAIYGYHMYVVNLLIEVTRIPQTLFIASTSSNS